MSVSVSVSAFEARLTRLSAYHVTALSSAAVRIAVRSDFWKQVNRVRVRVRARTAAA